MVIANVLSSLNYIFKIIYSVVSRENKMNKEENSKWIIEYTL